MSNFKNSDSSNVSFSSFFNLIKCRFIERVEDLLQARWRVIGIGLCAVLIATVFWFLNQTTHTNSGDVVASLPHVATTFSPSLQDSHSNSQNQQKVGEVVAQVSGAVNRPGVYRAFTGARVGELIEQSGGLSPDADADSVNRAAKVNDGQVIYVLRKGQSSIPPIASQNVNGNSGSSNNGEPDKNSPIDINTADESRLADLPGVGPATAKAIVEYRVRHGQFRSVDDLGKVHGIGPSKLAQIRTRARV